MNPTRTLPALKSGSCLLAIVLLSLAALTACQKEPEPDATADTPVVVKVPVTPVATADTASKSDAVDETDTPPADTRDIDAAAPQDDSSADAIIGADGITPNADTAAPSLEQTTKSTQVTEVKYSSAAGDTLSVVFETAATGELNAIVTMPNQPSMTLAAPAGQGNNPTYRSQDGSIELVSHGGGSSIDLIKKGTITSFEAISADAKVVTQP